MLGGTIKCPKSRLGPPRALTGLQVSKMQLLTRTFLDDIENDDAKSSHAQGATQHNEQNNETESIRKEGRGGGDRGKEIRIGLDEELSLSVSFYPMF